MTVFVPSGWGRAAMAVVIPARNEATRLGAALSAVAGQADIVVVANGCDDDTAAIARAQGAAVIETPADPGGVGTARRRGMDLALSGRASILATTDADCRLAPDWHQAVMASLRKADAVCGYIVPDAEEFAVLPPLVQRHMILGDRINRLESSLEALRNPVPWNPAPCHSYTPGASLAFTRTAYLAAGGFAPVPCNEDKRLIERMGAVGLRIAQPCAVRVIASCRSVGRAPGGMADDMAERHGDAPRLRREISRMQRRLAAVRSEPSPPIPQPQEVIPSVPPFQQTPV